MRKDFVLNGRPFMPTEEFLRMVESFARIMRDRRNAGPPFWQRDWKKLRRRGWKQRRSSGLH